MNRLFTSDTHFNHLTIAKLRGFDNVIEHDDWIINIWNSQVSKKDEVWHLGDFCFGEHKTVRRIRARLNGQIHLILGNHDYNNKIYNIKGLFSSTNDIKEIKIEDNKTILCHYAMRVWSCSHWNSWQLFGHSHGKLEGIGKQYDVGIDKNNYNLLKEQNIIEIMNKLLDNINLIRKDK